MTDVRSIFEWLVDGAPGAPGPAEVVARVSDGLLAAGVPLCRTAAFVRTLHPHILGRSFNWKPGEAVVVGEASYDVLQSDHFQKSPVAEVFRSGKTLRRKLVDPASPRDYPVLDDLAAQGITDYLVAPLVFLSGQVHAITFSSSAPDGFTDEHIAALLDLMRPLSRVAEIFALSRTAVNLLNTYVGRNAGERIIAGKIHRGDTDSIRAVVWFSDLRGFTALASTIPPNALIRVLNDVFECQVAAIEKRGGEVLKFIGDGLFAIFPIEGTDKTPGQLCDCALEAADDAFQRLRALNVTRAGRGEAPIRFGLALHLGEIAYGNIGSAGRLDFTCIGPAVNVAARLEGLTGKLERPLVVSADFAKLASRAMASLGSFELKGVTGTQEVLAPPNGEPLSRW